MDSSFCVRWDLGYLTDLRASILGQVHLTCLEVGWVRVGTVVSCPMDISSPSLSSFLSRRLKKADTFPTSLMANSS